MTARRVLADARPRATLAAVLATTLASLVLLPVFRDPGWVPAAWCVVAAVGVTGLVSRGVRLPVALHPVVEAGVLLTMLTVLYARPGAFAAVLPGPVAIGDLRDLAQVGMADAALYTTPAPTTTGLVLLVVGGVGLVALVVDVIGVSLRQPALAGVPLLALYTVPAVLLRGGVPWWVFPLAAIGWLVLLAVDERDQVLSWGIVLGGRRRPAAARGAGPNAHSRPAAGPPRLAGIGSSGRRLGAAALVAAVVVPALVPGLGEPVWGTGGGSGSGAGGVTADDGPVRLDPFVSLRRDIVENNDREVIRYYTDDPDPTYLRLATLERFDGTTWSPNELVERRPLSDPLAPPRSSVGDIRQAAYNITVGELSNPALPVPFPALSVSAVGESADLLGGAWTWDPQTRTVGSDGASAQGRQYQVRSLDVRPTRAELQDAGSAVPAELGYLLETPADLPPSVAELAGEVTSGARTPYDQAAALQNWFVSEGGFRYSTSVRSGNDSGYLEQFLTERVGYCEQYAAAMAVMARTLGIPSRVSIGFTAGEPQPDGTWKVTVRDAHAWPELWFDGIGWVYFEPTPRADPGSGVVAPPYASAPEGDDAGTDSGGAQADGRDPRGIRAAEEAAIRALQAAAPAADVPDEDSWRRWVLAAIAALLAVAAAVPASVRAWRRRRRLHAAPVEGAWAELRDIALDAGLPWSDADTPRQAGTRLVSAAGLSGAPQQAVDGVVAAVEAGRYARDGADAIPTGRVRDSLAALRRALRARLSWPARVRSAVLPPSVVGR